MSVDPQVQTLPPQTGARGQARRKARVAALVFLLLGVWICLEAAQLPFGSFRMPGAGFFPLLLGITLCLLSLCLLGGQLLGSPEAGPPEAPVRAETFTLIGAMFAAAWLFERAGFLCTMALFLGVLLKVLGQLRWTLTIVLALTGSLVAYVVFGRVLLIGLPSGVLPF